MADVIATTATGTPAAAPDERGELIVADKVREKIAARAALDVVGVVRHSTGLGSLLGDVARKGNGAGDDFPRAAVDSSSTPPTVAVTIAVNWPCALTTVCRDVRTHVGDELERLGGSRPPRVDVSVAHILSGATVTQHKDGFVTLPDPVEPERIEPTTQEAGVS